MSEVANEQNYVSKVRIVRRETPMGNPGVAITMTIPVEALRTLYREIEAASAFIYSAEDSQRGNARIVRATLQSALRQAINYLDGTPTFYQDRNEAVVLDDNGVRVNRPIIITQQQDSYGIHR